MSVNQEQLAKYQGGLRTGFGPIAAAKTIYGGTLAFFAAGYLTDVVDNGANAFAGVMRETYDNSDGEAGDINGEMWTEGDFELVGSSFTQATVGADIYATDNYTITTSPTNATYIGRCVDYVSGTKIIVRINTTPTFDGT